MTPDETSFVAFVGTWLGVGANYLVFAWFFRKLAKLLREHEERIDAIFEKHRRDDGEAWKDA